MTVKKTEEAPKKGGRPSEYTDDLAKEICRRIAEGDSEYKIGRDENMPSRATIQRWKTEKEWFRDRSARARKESAFKFDDERIEEIEDLKRTAALHLKLGKDLPKGYVEAKKLICQELARSAALRNDELFGDRKKVSIDAKVDGGGLADVYAKIAEAVKGEQD